jgi:3-oxoacyl-(acyl-carrier-protein) synthase
VVVTGLGMLSPLGPSVSSSWNRLIAGESGIVSLLNHHSTKDRRDEFAGLPSTVAGVVDDASWLNSVSRDEQRQLGRFAQMALAASREALNNAKIEVAQLSPEERERIVQPLKDRADGRVCAVDQGLEVLRTLTITRWHLKKAYLLRS